MLPVELVEEICHFCDVKTTIALQKSKIFRITYEKLISLLSKKIGIDVSSVKLREIEYMSTLEYQLFLLNTLGRMYHTGFGLNDDSRYLELYIDKYNGDLCEFIEQYADDEDEDEGMAYFHDYILKRLTTMIIPFSIVIIKYQRDAWYSKPDEWYNKKSIWWKDDKFQNRLLPFLNTRPYITVVEHAMQVSISVEKKGSSITIDDILFATRALAADDIRTVVEGTGYRIISINDNILTLEPNMDNFST